MPLDSAFFSRPKINIFSGKVTTSDRGAGGRRRSSPRIAQWNHVQNANSKMKHADKHKSELTDKQKRQRKRAKKTAKSMMKNDTNYKAIIGGMNATDGFIMSQTSAYEKGRVLNSKN